MLLSIVVVWVLATAEMPVLTVVGCAVLSPCYLHCMAAEHVNSDGYRLGETGQYVAVRLGSMWQ
jgi:hypothetical protein